MVYLVTYELRSPEKDYTPLFSYIEKDVGEEVLHVMQNVWWIKSSNELDLSDLCDKLRAHMDNTDLLSISRLEKGYYNGWLPGTSWEWLKERV